MTRPTLDHAITLIKTGRVAMATTLLVQLAELGPRQPAAVDPHAARLIRELRDSLTAAHGEIEGLRKRLSEAEARAATAERKLRAKRMTMPAARPAEPHGGDRRRLATMIVQGHVTPAATAAVLRVREVDILDLADGRTTLARSAWRRLWQHLS